VLAAKVVVHHVQSDHRVMIGMVRLSHEAYQCRDECAASTNAKNPQNPLLSHVMSSHDS
jgi:hypothetical protein